MHDHRRQRPEIDHPRPRGPHEDRILRNDNAPKEQSGTRLEEERGSPTERKVLKETEKRASSVDGALPTDLKSEASGSVSRTADANATATIVNRPEPVPLPEAAG
jgi:hypothetical protein